MNGVNVLQNELNKLTDSELLEYYRLMKKVYDEGKRSVLIKMHGVDTKKLYHVVRLASQCEQILIEGDLDLEEKGRREQMKAIRYGSMTQEEIHEWFAAKEKQLEALYANSSLPHSPDEQAIKQLLIDCLEHHYGDLSRAFVNPDREKLMLNAIAEIIDRYRRG